MRTRFMFVNRAGSCHVHKEKVKIDKLRQERHVKEQLSMPLLTELILFNHAIRQARRASGTQNPIFPNNS